MPLRLPHLGFSRDSSFVLQQSEEENADEEFDFRPAAGAEEDQFMSRYYHETQKDSRPAAGGEEDQFMSRYQKKILVVKAHQ